jgi:methyltransferase (TIGR00027 family)
LEQNRESATARGAALVRAIHHQFRSPLIFDDPYAVCFLPPAVQFLVKRPVLSWLIRGPIQVFGSLEAIAVVRNRYAEDRLAAATCGGIRQYVLVGAGFDSFALRRPDWARALRVFELDHPATQSVKRAMLDSLSETRIADEVFVEIDFEREAVGEALRRSAYDPAVRSFYSWLGTTYYLTHEAIRETLSSIARISTTGTEVVLDYWVEHDLLAPRDRGSSIRFERFAARRGEPVIGYWNPQGLKESVEPMGYSVLEDIDAPEQLSRYFHGRRDGLVPSSAVRLAHLRFLGSQ